MIKKFEMDTSGVLVLCSKNALKDYYADREFDYNFPEGIFPLINSGAIAVVVTESGEDIKGRVFVNESVENEKNFTLLSQQKFRVLHNDNVYALSHSAFTQICDNVKGDIDAFKFWEKPVVVKGVAPGWYSLSIHGKIPKGSYYPHIILQLESVETAPSFADVTDVARI